MIEVVPESKELIDRAHIPLEQIKLVRRLIDQHASPFGFPRATPRITSIVGLLAPAIHCDCSQDGMPQFPLVDGLFDSQRWSVEASLAHRADFHSTPFRSVKDGITVLQ